MTRDELLDSLRNALPNYKANSLSNVISTLIGELGVLRHDGNLYVLTEQGEAVLETEEPSPLADWLLTRVLAVDAAVAALRDKGPLPRPQLTAFVRESNPGWTTDFAPNSILHWLRSLGVVEDNESGKVQLTDEGKEWAKRVRWEPERLRPEPERVTGISPPEPAARPEDIRLPDVGDIVGHVQARGHFRERVVRDLHAGIWGHQTRHFAILTGLSGTGKTLLARSYADAIGGRDGHGSDRLLILPVQPGWHDPGALLGYVNPLRPSAYVRTVFLEFLLRALQDGSTPHVAVLDEMNLSHPEQYLAPILSAMETNTPIDLHREGEEFDGIPPVIPYPSNLVLIGTVNMDETTHGLSDKVLDRAFTLEFWDVDVAAFAGWSRTTLSEKEAEQTKVVLVALYDALRPARLHFGWRSVEAVLGFLSKTGVSGDGAFQDALDSAVFSKILPKLRGDDSSRFRDALEAAEKALADQGLLRSRQRVEELKADLDSTGTARFWR